MNGAASTQTDGASTQVLKRERKDLSEEVQRVGPLPVPALEPPYAMRAAVSDDAEMVSEWMNRPHLAQTWEYPWPPARWRQHLDAQLEGTYSLPLIATLRGEECAYLEIYWAAKDMISRHYEAQPYDIGLHAAIADLRLVNRGLGPRLLPRIVANVFDQEPRCERIMFDPDVRNSNVRRLCDFVGCRCLGERDAPNRRMVLYALERPTQSS
ncbi:siderophore biosynthesis protein [Mycobacterium sp. 1100029.7]|nr:siderophore biosynthesis protein [Mycobacterium sp. 1100029.7]